MTKVSQTIAGIEIIPYLQMGSQANLVAYPNEPLRRVILIPLDCIPIVHGELMVEVMIAFANRDKSSNDMITRSVLVIEWRLAEPMCE